MDLILFQQPIINIKQQLLKYLDSFLREKIYQSICQKGYNLLAWEWSKSIFFTKSLQEILINFPKLSQLEEETLNAWETRVLEHLEKEKPFEIEYGALKEQIPLKLKHGVSVYNQYTGAIKLIKNDIFEFYYFEVILQAMPWIENNQIKFGFQSNHSILRLHSLLTFTQIQALLKEWYKPGIDCRYTGEIVLNIYYWNEIMTAAEYQEIDLRPLLQSIAAEAQKIALEEYQTNSAKDLTSSAALKRNESRKVFTFWEETIPKFTQYLIQILGQKKPTEISLDEIFAALNLFQKPNK